MMKIMNSRYRIVGLFVFIVAGYPLIFSYSSYLMGIAITVFIFAIAAMSLGLLSGYAGQISIGQNGFLLIGSYCAALGGADLGIPMLLVIPLSGLVCAVISLVIGMPATRLKGHFLALATLGFGVAVPQIALSWKWLTHGYAGMAVQRAEMFENGIRFYYLCGFIFLCTMIIALNITHSALGRGFLAVRESEVAALANGIPTSRLKLQAFMISAFFTGMAGALHGYWLRFVTPNDFTLMESLLILAMLVVGGLESIVGAAIGAAVLIIVPEMFRQYTGVNDFVIGVAIILVILFTRRGLAGVLRIKF